MNIAIDARGVHGNKAGIAIYIEEIIKKIIETGEKQDKFILYSNKDIEINAKLPDNFIIKKAKTRLPRHFLDIF